MLLRKRKKYMVRVQHTELDDAVIEGIWSGMFEGHYHIKAARVIVTSAGGTTQTPYRVNEILVPHHKVAFLEIIAEDQSLGGGKN